MFDLIGIDQTIFSLLIVVEIQESNFDRETNLRLY